MQKLKVTTTATELLSFSELCNASRRIVPNFALFVSPLFKSIEQTQKKEFGALNKEELKSTKVVKETLISPLVFTLPKLKGRFTLETEGSDR